MRTQDGLVPLSNFITRKPVAKLAEINRINQKRYFDIKAAVLPDLKRTVVDENGESRDVIINANERIAYLTEYLEANPMPAGISWEWTGDQQDQAESQAFLSSAFSAALALIESSHGPARVLRAWGGGGAGTCSPLHTQQPDHAALLFKVLK